MMLYMLTRASRENLDIHQFHQTTTQALEARHRRRMFSESSFHLGEFSRSGSSTRSSVTEACGRMIGKEIRPEETSFLRLPQVFPKNLHRCRPGDDAAIAPLVLTTYATGCDDYISKPIRQQPNFVNSNLK